MDATITTPSPSANGAHPLDTAALATIERLDRIEALRANGWKVDMSAGQSATLCDPTMVTERQRRAFKAASVNAKLAKRDGTDPAAGSALIATDDYMIVMFLRAWTLAAQLPNVGYVDSLQDLPGVDYDKLVLVCTDLVPEAFVDMTISREEGSPFSPTSA